MGEMEDRGREMSPDRGEELEEAGAIPVTLCSLSPPEETLPGCQPEIQGSKERNAPLTREPQIIRFLEVF